MKNNSHISISVTGATILIAGDLNFSTVVQLQADLRQAFETMKESAIEINLKDLKNFNSAILPTLLDCLRMAAKNGKSCFFSHAPSNLTSILKIASLDFLSEQIEIENIKD